MNRTLTGHKLNLRMPYKGAPRRPGIVLPSNAAPIVHLMKYDNQILDQGQEGDCTGAASGGMWMYLQILKWRIANKGYSKQQLLNYINSLTPVSMDFIYSLELQAEGNFGTDAGAQVSSGAMVLSTYGACTADMMPNDHMGFEEKPDQAALSAAAQHKVATYSIMDLQQVRQCHTAGYPVFFGIPVFASFVQSQAVMTSGFIPMPAPFEQPVGGHALKTIGHDDSQRLLILSNSWGTSVGNAGRFYLPYAYWSQYASDAHTGRLI